MITVRYNDLEIINNMVNRISSESEEILYILKKLAEETDADIALKLYPEDVVLEDDLEIIRNSLTRIMEISEDLKYSSGRLLKELQ